jgi:response regulator NasT
MNRTRVLICEDEGLTSLRLRATLTRFGYEVVGCAANGAEVIAAAAELRPDLILMDIEMPCLDGISATRKIMTESPTAVLMLSAYNETEVVQSALAAGASGYVVKPVTDDQLKPALSAALDRFAAIGAAGP